MTRDIERILDRWFEEGPTEVADRVIAGALDLVDTTDQRRASHAPRRYSFMPDIRKLALAAAVVVAAVGLALVALQPRSAPPVGASPGGTPIPATPAASTPVVSPAATAAAAPSTPPSATPSAAVSATPAPTATGQHTTIVVAGTDSYGVTGIRMTAALPAGWQSGPYYTHRGTPNPPAGTALTLSVVGNTFQDPCKHVERSPTIGSTVEAVTAALLEIPELKATQPVQTTIAEHQATYLELTVPPTLSCAPELFNLWRDGPGGNWWALGLNEQIRVWLVEQGGYPIAIWTRSYPGTSAEAKAELEGILASLAFESTT